MRRGAAHEQGHHVVFFDQLARVLGRLGGLEVVVQRDQLDLLAVHAALGVDVVQVGARAQQRFAHAGGHRAGDGRGLSDEDVGVRRATGEQQAGHERDAQAALAQGSKGQGHGWGSREKGRR